VATTSEHRLKQSDIRSRYGKGPYHGANEVGHYRGEKMTKVQGPNSHALKYQPNLCGTCNSTTTQPFDISYEKFQKWVHANENKVLRRRFIDFFEVFGDSFETDQLNLYKYYVKSFGCRLNEAGINIPKDLIALLPETTFRTGLRLTFWVNEAKLEMPKIDRDTFIGKGDLIGIGDDAYNFNEYVSWLTVEHWYLSDPEPTLGSVWTANARVVYLGAHNPFDESSLSLSETIEYRAKIDARRREIET
jgi:hypothetical protein